MTVHLTFPDGCALVAGGTGTVGAGVVERLAEAGLPVVFTYNSNEQKAKALESQLRARDLKVQACAMDLTCAESIDDVLVQCRQFGGQLHTVACAAGAPIVFDTIDGLSMEALENFMHNDALAYIRLFKKVLPVLRRGGGGSITATTTIALKRVVAFDGISPFSKGAVQAVLRQLAAEEAAHGVRCNAVEIGWISNTSVEDFRAYAESLGEPLSMRIGTLIDQLQGLLKSDAPGSPRDAGNLFAFLASNEAKFITGQSIALDGGITL